MHTLETLNILLKTLSYRPAMSYKGLSDINQLEFMYNTITYFLTFNYNDQTIHGYDIKYNIDGSNAESFKIVIYDDIQLNIINEYDLTVFINTTISQKHNLSLPYFGYYIKGFMFYGEDVALQYWFKKNDNSEQANIKHPSSYFLKDKYQRQLIFSLNELLLSSIIYTQKFNNYDQYSDSYYPTLSFAQCYCESCKTSVVIKQSKYYGPNFTNPRLNIDSVIDTVMKDLSSLVFNSVRYKSMQVLFK